MPQFVNYDNVHVVVIIIMALLCDRRLRGAESTSAAGTLVAGQSNAGQAHPSTATADKSIVQVWYRG